MHLLALSCAAGSAACDGTLPELAPPALRPLLSGHPLAAKARLVGDGPSSCSGSSDGGGSADRFCAFSVPAAADTGKTELWVINVTRVAAGKPAPCDGSSPHCLRMTDTLWTGNPIFSPSHPFVHAFSGSTLVFHPEGRSKPDELYEGMVSAWRPGWSQPRVVTSDKGVTCSAHPRAAAAVCIDSVTMGRTIELDVLAGPLVDLPASRLPNLGRIRPLRSDGARAWAAVFSSAGDDFALSAPGAGDREVLRVGRTADLGNVALREIATDAGLWSISHDGRKVYFLRDFNYDQNGSPSGTLVMADFPSGAGAAPLQPRVGRYVLVGDPAAGTDRGIGFFRDVTGDFGTFAIQPERARPDKVVTIADNVEGALVSPDGRFSVFERPNNTGDPDAVLARNDGSGSCLLAAKRGFPVFGVHFPPAATRVFWAEGSEEPDVTSEGYLARPEDCGDKQRFATNLEYLATVRDSLVVYGETPAGAQGMTLRYAHLTRAQQWPGEGVVTIGRNADAWISLVDTVSAAHVVYQVDEGPPEGQGIYVYGPIGPPAR